MLCSALILRVFIQVQVILKMKHSIQTLVRRGYLLAGLLLALGMSACGGGVGEGNTLASIAITDNSFVRPTGVLQVFQCFPTQLRVLGTFDNGSLDTSRTDQATWRSSDSAVVHVSNANSSDSRDFDNEGNLLPKGTLIPSASVNPNTNPTVTITAEYVGLTASQDVVVRHGTLEVTPSQITLAVGTTVQMFASAILGGGATDTPGTNRILGFNDGVAWESTDAAVAKVDELSGVVTAVAAGPAVTIRAKSGISCPTPTNAEVQLSVINPALQNISLQTTALFSLSDIGRNSSALLQLVGHFANDFKQELNRQLAGGAAVLESSEQSSGLSVNGAIIHAASNAAHNLQPKLTARFDPNGNGSQAQGFDTTTTINGNKRVNANGLAIQPAAPKMLAGTAMDLNAIGNYVDAAGADQPDQNLYRNSFWETSDRDVATVSEAIGRVFAGDDISTAKTADIKASRFDPVSNLTLTSKTTVTVLPFTAASVQSMTVSCPATIPLSSAADCTATANFVGGGSQDVSLFVIWGSSNTNPAIAKISNAQVGLFRENEVNRPIAPNSLPALSSRTAVAGRVFTGPTAGSTDITATLFDPEGVQIATSTTTVNVAGAAALDSDQDGVPDAQDQCPNTPAGSPVNAVGCPDTDGDGVFDNQDTCPNTPSNETANAQGCSPSQLDDDNDGVSNAQDRCPNTPSGQPVDTQNPATRGCANSQKDTDNDGVLDNADQCCTTPRGNVESPTQPGCPLTVPPTTPAACPIPS